MDADPLYIDIAATQPRRVVVIHRDPDGNETYRRTTTYPPCWRSALALLERRFPKRWRRPAP